MNPATRSCAYTTLRFICTEAEERNTPSPAVTFDLQDDQGACSAIVVVLLWDCVNFLEHLRCPVVNDVCCW